MRVSRWFALVLVVGGVGCGKSGSLSVTLTPTEVIVAHPSRREVKDYEEFTGHTDAILSVQIKSRVTGYLDRKEFLDGQDVVKNDVLYAIDDRPYKAALDSAEAMFEQGQAHKKRLAADYQRASNLFQKAVIGKQEFDLVSSNFAEAEAQLGASKAQLDNARLNMEFTKVRAPMDGRLSRTLVDPGNLIRQNQTILNDIVSTDHLYVYFDVSVDAMDRVSSVIEQGRVGGANNREVPVEVGTSIDADRYEDAMKHLRDLNDEWLKRLADLKVKKKTPAEIDLAQKDHQRMIEAEEKKVPPEFPYPGMVNFSENKLDAATGTLRVRGTIDNPAPALLTPGLFVRVRLPIGDMHSALLIPEDSIGSDQGRSFVYLVNARDEIEYRPVTTGALFSGEAGSKLRAIKEGITADERFIQSSDTIRKVRPGAKVDPKFAPPPGLAEASSPKMATR